MAVQVETEDRKDTYTRATKWHIDEHRILHVVGDTGNLAAYGPGAWIAARLVSDED